MPERLQPAAFALDVASQSLLFALGPLLVAALAQIARPGVALATTGLVGLLGTWAMTSAEPCREAHGSRRRPDWYGPLRSAELRGMAFVLALVGVAPGAQSVAGTAWAEGINRPASAGLLLGAFSAGSFVGGLLFSRCARPAGNRTLALLLCTFAIGWIPLALAPASLPLMTCLAIVPGLTLSPLLGTVFDRVGRSADPGLVTETFSWLVSAVGVGSAAGTAIAGLIADHKGASFAYAFAATSAAGAMGRLAVHLTSIARPREWRAVLPDTPGGSIRNNRSVIPWRHPINPVN